jgi:tetratricopeptide (TPR) repeat protein/DNA-binding CsgD family transcriptional regulator
MLRWVFSNNFLKLENLKKEKINGFMTNNDSDSEKNSYFLPIETINGIKFTPREIDILACILGRRTAKKIASSLHISPKTVENHIRNIMQKLDCNSQERIIDFIEETQEAPLLKQRYTRLFCQASFEQSLKDISIQTKKHPLHCTIIDVSEDATHTPLIIQLKQHLENAGIPTEIKVENGLASLDSLRKDSETHSEECRLYVLSKALKEEIQICPELGKTLQKESKDSSTSLFLISHKERKGIITKCFTIKNLTSPAEIIYYYSFFELLKYLSPALKLDEIAFKLKNQCEGTIEAPGVNFSPQPFTDRSYKERKKAACYPSNIFFTLKKWKFPLAFCLLAIVCFSAGFISFKNGESGQGSNAAHSDLTLPAKFSLLDRPELINEINTKLKGQEGIQTIALVGLAGSGKKVLARQYARGQDTQIVWEINSEVKETIVSSFERLAYALAKSEEDQRSLRALQDMNSLPEREDKIILFVQEKLKNYPNWILIYYNLEDFSHIEKYFPQDFGWGRGKVIVTTTDNNIQDNKYINQVIEVGELNEKQQLDLFVKILHKNSSEKLLPEQNKSVKGFLNQIPPFPLDVSIAAYYIKETKTPYDTYIKYLNAHTPEFNQLQEDVLKEIGGYKKTRYHIVSLSLKKLLNSSREYRDLLLYLSLLGSKNIPRDLLYTYKDKLTVDNFIHDLNKYSLTIFTLYDLDQTIPTFSLHRSIQDNILDYFKKDLNSPKNENSIPLIFTAIEKYTDDIIRKEDSPRIQLILEHCIKFMNSKEGITDVIKGRMGLTVGTLYYYMGNFLKSKEVFEKSLTILLSYPANNYPVIGAGLARLGNLHREFGQYEQAKGILEKSLIIYKKHLPNDYIGTAFVLRHLARVYRSLGNYEKAKSLIEESLILYKNSFPGNPIQVAHSEAYLGKIYKDLGRYSEAKNLLQKSYNFSVKHYSLEHPRTARILRDLGQVYYLEGNFVKGEELTQKALDIFQKYEHPELYTVFENLAELHLKKLEHAKQELGASQSQNFQNQATDYLAQALAIVKIHFPEDSPHITRIHSKIIKLKEDRI